MANLTKIFQSFKGLDLRSSDILRSQEAATQLLNMTYRQTGAMSKRKGYQFSTDSGTGGYGLTTFNNVDLDTGNVSEQVITIDNNLHKLVSYSFTITYTATANSNTYYEIFLDTTTSTFKFYLYDNGTQVLSEDLGDGTEGSPYLISDLTTAIDALANFTCTAATGGASTPAAFLPVKSRTSINTVVSPIFYTWQQISTPSGFSNPFNTFYGQRTSSDFENATFSQINDVMYIATGHDNLMKYDGNRVYRAGMKQHPSLTVADAAGGTAFGIGEVHTYQAEYEYKDAKENTVTGLVSATKTHTQVANKDIDITLTYLTDTNFNIDQAVINGAQVSVNTITVDSSATLKVGDYVYLSDSISGQIVSRKITAIPNGTSLTINGNAVTVADNAIISTVKIVLWRTENHSSTPNSPTLFYLSKEFVNDSSGTTFVYTDSLSDTSLTGNAQFVQPLKERALPPKCKYIEEWRGQLIMSGSLSKVNTVYYSDIGGVEYFPSDSSFDVDRAITGLKALDNVLYVFKKTSIDGVTGDLSTDTLQVDKLSREGVGCAAHQTIQEVQGSLFFLSDRGVFSINNEGLQNVGANIEPKFNVNNPFSFKQATAYVWQADKKYILFMPSLPVNASYSSDTDSEIYVYDYFRQAWLEWGSYNLMGGMTEASGVLFKMSRETNTFSYTRLHQILQNQNQYDYADHTEAISFIYKSPWFSEGEPSIWKKYLRAKIHSYDTSVNDFENDAFTLLLETEHDYNTARQWTSITYDFAGGAEGWGLGPWGAFPWGELRLPQLKKKLASKKVRSLRIILTNDVVYENVLVSGIELEVAMPYRSELKE